MRTPKPTNPLVEDMAADTLAACKDVLDALMEIETPEANPGRNEIIRCVMSALDYEIRRGNERPKRRFTLNIAEGEQ